MSNGPIDRIFEQAVQHHQRGDLAQAEAHYRQVLAQHPNHVGALHYLGIVAHQVGRNDAALELINRSIALNATQARFFSNQGEVLRALGKAREAVDALRTALRLEPDSPDFVSNLGIALFETDQLDEAERLLRRASELDKKLPEPHLHLARLLRSRGKIDEAIVEARRAVEISPNHLNALLNLGMTLTAARRFDEAEVICRNGIAQSPNSFLAHSSLGAVFGESGRAAESAAEFEIAVQLNPHYAPAHAGVGMSLHQLGLYDRAAVSLRRAVELRPDDHGSHNALGLALLHAGQLDAAIESFRKAQSLKADSADYLNNYATALEEKGQLDETMQLLERAAAIDPNHPLVQSNLGKQLTVAGFVAEAIPHMRRAVKLAPDEPRIHSNLLLCLHYLPDLSPPQMLQEHIDWAERYARKLEADVTPHENDRNPDRPLRIGYVSADFAGHSVADFIEQILASHDKSQFETVCFSDVARPDAYTKRLRQYPSQWIDIATANDERVAQIVREQRIDILIDLAGHTARNRLLMFARKPAPVQVTYLGYPDTTGLKAIDCRFTDAAADPVSLTDEFHTETLWRLPRTFLCYRPFPESKDVGPLPADARGQVTFASFNNLSKVSPQVIEAWSRILLAVPGSRMLVKASALAGMARDRLLELFGKYGVGPERLDLIGRIQGFGDHLALYNTVDVALDTFPYHGTTTTCEALWMGVPVVTLAGQTHVSRVGVSILGQVGLNDLVANDAETYVNIAAGFANDRDRLRTLRSELRDRMRQSPLLDAVGVTREIEAAYREMWKKWSQ